MKTKDASLKWKISARRINTLCKEGRIEGAVKFGNTWAIPLTASKPMDARRTNTTFYITPSAQAIQAPITFFPCPQQKINVFISSECDSEAFKKERAKIKTALEQTNLINVYSFESSGSSTHSARKHYTLRLEDCDVCIFFIDNEIGITTGVQEEIDIVNKHRIHALYYFCDERNTTPTELQQRLSHPDSPKYDVIHSFSDFAKNGTQGLIDDVLFTYRLYCKRHIDYRDQSPDARLVSLLEDQRSSYASPREVVEKIDKTKHAFAALIAPWVPLFEVKENKFDDMCATFTSVLFHRKAIKEYNTSLLLGAMKKIQTPALHRVVKVRWDAINAYFSGDMTTCIAKLKDALKKAKKNQLPVWFVKDILIDLRNQEVSRAHTKGGVLFGEAQKQLSNDTAPLYYPVLDRLYKELDERSVNDLFKQRLKASSTITLGSSLTLYTNLIASAFCVAMYNGSLTHILSVYENLKRAMFVLVEKEYNWIYQLNLLKFTIFSGTNSDIKRIDVSYPSMITSLNAKEADEILAFCDNKAMPTERMRARLQALRVVGYYLDDKTFQSETRNVLDQIKNYIRSAETPLSLFDTLIDAFGGFSLRLPIDDRLQLVLLFLENGLKRWYDKIFSYIASYVDISKCNTKEESKLLHYLTNNLFEEYKSNSEFQSMLISLRKQDPEKTQHLDRLISERMPEFYNNIYSLETKIDDTASLEKHLFAQVECAAARNATQGRLGIFFGYQNRVFQTIRNILLSDTSEGISTNSINATFHVASDAVIKASHHTAEKCDAMDLILLLYIQYNSILSDRPEQLLLTNIKERWNEMKDDARAEDFNALSVLAYQISLLESLKNKAPTTETLLCLASFGDDPVALDRACRSTEYYIEDDKKGLITQSILFIIMQQAITWSSSDLHDIRWHGYRILLLLSCHPEMQDSKAVICERIRIAFDAENAYIKSLIIRELRRSGQNNHELLSYICNKGKNDTNYMIREFCTQTTFTRTRL